MKYLRFPLLIFILSLFSTSCLEITERIQLNSDGTARVTLSITVPDIPDKEKKGGPVKNKDLDKEVREIFSPISKEGLTLEGQEEKEITGIKYFYLKGSAKKMTDLRHLYAQMKEASAKSGKSSKEKEDDASKEAFEQIFTKSRFLVKKTKNGTIQIQRSFSPPKIKRPKKSPKKGQEQEAELGKELEETFLNVFRIRFEFLSPTKVVRSNAALALGHNLRWETTMGYLMRKKFDIQIEIESTPELEAGIR